MNNFHSSFAELMLYKKEEQLISFEVTAELLFLAMSSFLLSR